MITAAAISFRETLEMFLIVFSLIAYIYRVNMKQLIKYIYIGIGSGILSGILLGGAVFMSTKSLTGEAGNIFQGGMLLFVSVVMAVGIIMMGRQNSSNGNNEIENRYNLSSTAASIFLITYLTVFREILEVSIYTLPLLKQNIYGTLIADIAGLLSSLGIMLILYKTAVKLNISMILKILTFFLIYVGSDMFGEGLSSLFPQVKDISLAGMLLYGIPLFFLFLKNLIKNYIRKSNN